MTDDTTDYTEDDALEQLCGSPGQRYLLADTAFELLRPFAHRAEATWIADQTGTPVGDLPKNDHEQSGRLAFSEAVGDKQRQARNARGILSVLPHQPVLTYADLSAILVDALGGEPSDYQAAGSGFTADGKHSRNIKQLRDRLGIEMPDP